MFRSFYFGIRLKVDEVVSRRDEVFDSIEV